MFSPLGELEGRNGEGGASAMVIENVSQFVVYSLWFIVYR